MDQQGPKKDITKAVPLPVLFFGFFVLFLSYGSFFVPMRWDGFSIVSAGLNLLFKGSYTEYFFDHTHRGPLGAVLNALAYLVTGSLRWSGALVASVSAAAISVGLTVLVRRLGLTAFWEAPAFFLVFPFFPFALNSSAIHILQAAFFTWALVALLEVWRQPSVRCVTLLGLLVGCGAITHSYSVVLAVPLIGMLAVALYFHSELRWKRQMFFFFVGSLSFVAVLAIQLTLVYQTSGVIKLSAESFETLANWNLRHPASDLPTGETTLEELTGEATPESPGDLLQIFFRHPDTYWSYFLRPTQKGILQAIYNPLMMFLWLPLFAIGLISSRVSKEVLFYLVTLAGCGVVTLLLSTIAWAPRYWIPCLVATVPFVASGLESLRGRVSETTNLLGASEKQRRFFATLSMAGILILSSLLSFRMSYHPRNQENLVFDVGEFLTSSPMAPRAGSTIYTTHFQLHLWRQDYDWRSHKTLGETSLGGSEVYALLLNTWACDTLDLLSIDDKACRASKAPASGSHVPDGSTDLLLEDRGIGHRVVQTFTRGRDVYWLVRLEPINALSTDQGNPSPDPEPSRVRGD